MAEKFPAEEPPKGGRPSGSVVPDVVRVRRVSLADRTAEALKWSILADELHPGDRLPSERVLAESLNVSRTVLREALRRLVGEGVLHAEAARVLRIAPLERVTLVEGLEVDGLGRDSTEPAPRPGEDESAAPTFRTVRPERQRLSDQLIVALLSDIVAGLHSPGEPLDSESEMMERFGISRVVARESLRVLGSINVVAAQQGRRAVVQPWTQWDLFSPLFVQAFGEVTPPHDLWVQLYDTRRVVEGATAAVVATDATAEHVGQIMAMAAELDDLSTRREAARPFLVLDRNFHEAVAVASGNVPLRALLRSLFALTERQWSVDTLSVRMQTLPTAARQHRAIAAAIAARDPEAARRAMEEHIAWAKENELGPP